MFKYMYADTQHHMHTYYTMYTHAYMCVHAHAITKHHTQHLDLYYTH